MANLESVHNLAIALAQADCRLDLPNTTPDEDTQDALAILLLTAMNFVADENVLGLQLARTLMLRVYSLVYRGTPRHPNTFDDVTTLIDASKVRCVAATELLPKHDDLASHVLRALTENV